MKKCLVFLSLVSLQLKVSCQAKLVESKNKNTGEACIPFKKYKLPNGLTVILHEDHSDPMVVVNVTYLVGSANDKKNKSGCAHFFEHLMFHGSKHVKNGEHISLITEAGGTFSAQTQNDITVFTQVIPSNELEKVLWLESDRMGYFLDSFSVQKFQDEKATILNERKQSVDNNISAVIDEISTVNYYPPNHPYQKPTIGLEKDIKNITYEDLVAFCQKWYIPSNATLIIAGDIKADKTLVWVNKYFGRLRTRIHVAPKTHSPTEQCYLDKQIVIRNKLLTQASLTIKFPSTPKYQTDWAALECLGYILGNSDNGFLNKTLKNKVNYFYIGSFNYALHLSGEFNVLVLGLSNQNILEAKRLILHALESFDTVGTAYLKDQIENFKHTMEFRKIYEIETLTGRVFNLLTYESTLGQADFFEKELQMYNSLTPYKVRTVFRKYIKDHKPFISEALPSDSSEIQPDLYPPFVSAGQIPKKMKVEQRIGKYSDGFDRSVIPKPGIKNFTIHKNSYWRADWSNGIQIIGQTDNEVPVVSLKIYIDYQDQSNDSIRVLAQLFGKMLSNSDTKVFSADSINQLLSKRGIYFQVATEGHSLVIRTKCLAKYWPDFIQILKAKFLQPVFTIGQFNANKKLLSDEIANRNLDPINVADDAFHRLLRSSYFLERKSTAHNIDTVQLDNINQFYSDIAGRMQIVINGDIEKQKALSDLFFFTHLKTTKTSLSQSLIREKDSSHVAKLTFLNMPGADQAVIRIGMIINKPLDLTDSIYKLGLANFIFGGHFNSRINSTLREHLKYTYKAFSYLIGNSDYTEFFIETSVNLENIDLAIQEIYRQLDSFIKLGLTNEEIVFLKKSIAGHEMISHEAGPDKMDQLHALLESRTQNSSVQINQLKALEDLTAKDINGIIRKMLGVKPLIVLVVGDWSKAKVSLAKPEGFNIEKVMFQ